MKTYIKPDVKVKEIQLQSMVAASGDVKLGYGDAGSADGAEANSRRGSWGNLWNKED